MTTEDIPRLSGKRRQILQYIDDSVRQRGFPPSVREIGKAVDLASTSTVHTHLKILQEQGYLRRHPVIPRAIEICWTPGADTILERRPTRHVPVIGEVAAGTDVLAEENFEELLPLPQDFTGDGDLFMLKVRGESMIDAGILNGDYVVVQTQRTAKKNDIVVAGIPGDEATVKYYSTDNRRVVLIPANSTMQPMIFEDPNEVRIYGKVVTVIRRLE